MTFGTAERKQSRTGVRSYTGLWGYRALACAPTWGCGGIAHCRAMLDRFVASGNVRCAYSPLPSLPSWPPRQRLPRPRRRWTWKRSWPIRTGSGPRSKTPTGVSTAASSTTRSSVTAARCAICIGWPPPAARPSASNRRPQPAPMVRRWSSIGPTATPPSFAMATSSCATSVTVAPCRSRGPRPVNAPRVSPRTAAC